MKHFLLALFTSVLLAACGSTVKLDEVPVVDKAGISVNPSDAAGAGSAVGGGGVTPVNIGKSDQPGAMPTAQNIVYFDFDSFIIKPEFQSVIEAQARFIKTGKTRKVVIEGHTDERGGREYNLALGQKRAEAVRSGLGLLGVMDSDVEAVSFGKEKPALPGSDEAALAKNRRAEISYR